jgi:hypothetical protein
MVIIHRITPFAIGFTTAVLFTAAIHAWMPLSVSFGFLLLLPILLFSRLCQWQVRSFQFWYLVGTPIMFLLAAFGFLLLLEDPTARFALVGLVSSLLFVFGELVFAYIHLPPSYQPYSIEHLSLPMNVLSVFFLASLAFGTNTLLQISLPLLCLAFAIAVMFVVYGTLWVSKVSVAQAVPYALAGTLLATQLFAVLSFLPTGFYTNATLLALYFYVFLGMTRAQSLEKLSRSVARRYVSFGVLLAIIILGTARWV